MTFLPSSFSSARFSGGSRGNGGKSLPGEGKIGKWRKFEVATYSSKKARNRSRRSKERPGGESSRMKYCMRIL